MNSSDRVTIEIFTGPKPPCTRVCVCVCIRIRVYTCALPTSLATFNILPYGFAVQLYRGTREQDFAHPASVFIVARTCFRNRGYERGWLLQMGVIAKLRDGGNCQGSLLETWMLVDWGGFDENAFREFYVKSSATEEREERGESWQVVSRLLSLGF